MIYIKNIKKKFGAIPVLDDITLTIKKEECYCLIGKNGAGKSTLIHILINFLPSDEGSIELFGATYADDPQLIKRNIGVLPEFNPVIEEFSGYDYLRYVGLIYNLSADLIEKRINLLFNYFFEDTSQLQKRIAQFSKGMKIKIGICAAVIHKPRFLILDEPFENLDPIASNNLAAFLNDYRKKGNAILVSSHEINYVEKIATHLGVLENRTLIYSGSLEQIMNGSDKRFDEQVSAMLGYTPKSLADF